MHALKLRIIFTCILYLFLLYHGSYGDSPKSLRIAAVQSTICVGEPLILNVTIQFEKPQRDPKTGDVYRTIHFPIALLIEIKEQDELWLSEYSEAKLFQIDNMQYYPLDLPSSFMFVQDEKGLEYGNYYLVMYNSFKKGLVFDSPGTYKIANLFSNNLFSSDLVIAVLEKSEEKKQCILSDPNYCDFLNGVERKIFEQPEYFSKMISDLKGLIEQCPDSVLAHWAAVRVGFKSLHDAEKKKAKARHEKTKFESTAWDEASMYLEKGLKLPDDFPVREKVLYKLAEIECEKENYSGAAIYVDELSKKYPQGKYGRKASKYKEKILELQKKESK